MTFFHDLPLDIVRLILTRWTALGCCAQTRPLRPALVCKRWRAVVGPQPRCVAWRSPLVAPFLCCRTHNPKVFVEALQDVHDNATTALRSLERSHRHLIDADAYTFIHVSHLTHIVLGDDWTSRLKMPGAILGNTCCGGKGVHVSSSMHLRWEAAAAMDG